VTTARLVHDAYPDHPGLDTAISRALLVRTSDGEIPETIRLHSPGDVVAFGRQDVLAPGYLDAVEAARSHGFEAVERLTGGRAAVFHTGTIAFSWTLPDPSPIEGIRSRFQMISEVVAAALQRLGTDARVGEVPGEYCPGEFSVNIGGSLKVMGVGQRLARRAAHIGGVIVVENAGKVRNVLLAVYAALGLEWDPITAGAVADTLPGASVGRVTRALEVELGELRALEPAELDAATLELAASLVPDHLSPTR
jgi:lipoate-protein ligase A